MPKKTTSYKTTPKPALAVGDAQIFKLKPISVEGIQFTGTNGRDVVQFIRYHAGEARNGGKFVTMMNEHGKTTIRKGDFVTFDAVNLNHYEEVAFRAVHTVSKSNAVL